MSIYIEVLWQRDTVSHFRVYHKQKSWKVIEIYSELLKNLVAGILAEETLLGAEHLSQKALISYS